MAAALMLGAAEAKASPFLDDVIQGLDAPTFAQREEASERLRELVRAGESLGLRTIDRAVQCGLLSMAAQPGLTAEQRVRLIAPLRERFFVTPRAALGIAFGGSHPAGVLVGQTMPGFSVHERGLLRAGDVIVAIGGEPLINEAAMAMGLDPAQSALRQMIISRDPGESVTLRVLRGADELRVSASLGSFASLRQGNYLEPSALERAWRYRLRRLGVSEFEQRELGWTLDARTWAQRNRLIVPMNNPMIATAGRPIGGVEGLLQAMGDQFAAAGAPNDGWAPPPRPPAIVEMVRQGQVPDREAQVRDLRARQISEAATVLERLNDDLQRVQKRLTSGELSAVQRQEAKAQAASLMQSVHIYQEKLAQLLQAEGQAARPR